jgi:DNA-nicking Smr family endonuclease
MRSDSYAQQAGVAHPAGMLQTPQATGTAGVLKRGLPDATPQHSAEPSSPKRQHAVDEQQAAPRARSTEYEWEGRLDLRGQYVKGAIKALKGYIKAAKIIATDSGRMTKLTVITGQGRHLRKEGRPAVDKAPLRRAVSACMHLGAMRETPPCIGLGCPPYQAHTVCRYELQLATRQQCPCVSSASPAALQPCIARCMARRRFHTWSKPGCSTSIPRAIEVASL